VRENLVVARAVKSVARLGVALLVLVAACSGDGPSSPVPDNEVRVSNNAFSPATRTIAVGTTLTWRWVSGSSMHNVTFTGGPASPDQSSGTFARLFSAAGTFTYLCTIHGASMSGSVTVQ
jgi:plastocyanin